MIAARVCPNVSRAGAATGAGSGGNFLSSFRWNFNDNGLPRAAPTYIDESVDENGSNLRRRGSAAGTAPPPVVGNEGASSCPAPSQRTAVPPPPDDTFLRRSSIRYRIYDAPYDNVTYGRLLNFRSPPETPRTKRRLLRSGWTVRRRSALMKQRIGSARKGKIINSHGTNGNIME